MLLQTANKKQKEIPVNAPLPPETADPIVDSVLLVSLSHFLHPYENYFLCEISKFLPPNSLELCGQIIRA